MKAQLLATGRGDGIRRLFWPLVIAAFIFFASSRSNVASPGFTKIDDKIAHFGAYGLLGTLVCRIRGGGRAACWSLLVASAYGASDEWHQSFVPGRMCDSLDWVADTLGAALAIGLYSRWTWYRRLLETPVWPLRRRIKATPEPAPGNFRNPNSDVGVADPGKSNHDRRSGFSGLGEPGYTKPEQAPGNRRHRE